MVGVPALAGWSRDSNERSPSFEPYRQAIRPVHMQRFPRLPRRSARELEDAHPLEEFRQRHPGFQPRERRAEAEVDAMSNCDVRVGIAADVEPAGLGKRLRIAIG